MEERDYLNILLLKKQEWLDDFREDLTRLQVIVTKLNLFLLYIHSLIRINENNLIPINHHHYLSSKE